MCLVENNAPLFGISGNCVIAIIWFKSIDISVFYPLIFCRTSIMKSVVIPAK